MTDTKRTIMAFLLIAVIIILYPRYIGLISPQAEEAPEPQDVTVTIDTLQTSTEAETITPPVIREEEVLTSPATAPPTSQQWPERLLTIKTELYTATISPGGGGSLTYFELHDYEHGSGSGNVQLIESNGTYANIYPSYINLDGDLVNLVDNFEVLQAPDLDTTHLSVGSITLIYRYTFPSGARVTKQLTLQSDSYTIPIEITWEHPELEIGLNTYDIAWSGGLKPTENRIREEETYSKVYVYQGGELASQGAIRTGRDPVPRQQLNGSTQWVAMRTKYFTAAYISESDKPAVYGALSAEAVPFNDPANGDSESITRYYMAIGYDAREPAKMTLYLGPLSYFIIKDLDVDLQRTMNFGFSLIRPISKLVLRALVFVHDYIPNYGVVMILFAVFVRIITNPLTKKSAISSQKMQLVQPKVKALQEKYKGNPQKLNQEMMALWKKEGVNPLGGCLPLLIQMPVLIALFMVFRTTIELRGQPFVLWIKDLSVPDVVYTLPFSIPLYGSGVTILAIIMGVSMFIQQKISGASANPQQKPMMYMMSGMFFLIFNQFPSGLNLYYAFSNILSIFQQRNIRKQLQTDQKPEPPPAKKKRKS